MAFTQQEETDIRKLMNDFIDAMRPPEHIRPQLDYGYRLEGQHVFIFEIRPQLNKPEILRHSDFAKITYVRNTSVWKIYWMRGNLQWDAYPAPPTGTLKAALKLIDGDKYGCFYG